MWPLLLVMGCGFAGGSGTPLDDVFDELPPDAAIDAPIDIIVQDNIDFLPTGEETFTNADWTIDANTKLDTTALTSTPPLPTGVTFAEGTQIDGTKAAILRVKNLRIPAEVTLSAAGTRALFILSNNDVIIEGSIDVGARGPVAGPAGSAGGDGPGAGQTSRHDGRFGRYNDSGGGGGSFGTVGGAGGRAGETSSAAGGIYVLVNRLLGGASGGKAGPCSNLPGAGGGALLVYATNKITVKGAISAGGGGGAGGITNCSIGASAGAGGGSGGSIWLQSKTINGDGVLAANGGGGGGGAYTGNGGDGADGKASALATDVATGGIKSNTTNTEATNGGTGAVQGTPPSAIPNLNSGNGGGGGGGLGRIVYRAPDVGALRSSPTAVKAP